MPKPTQPNHRYTSRFGEDEPRRTPHLTRGQVLFSTVVFLVATYGATIITLAWRCPA